MVLRLGSIKRVYGNGQILELRIPRDRNGQFYPKVLTLLRQQQSETDRFVSALYAQGLTQSQLGDVFEQLYGRHYSSSSIGRMIEWMRNDVEHWRQRPLDQRYPVIFIDCLYVAYSGDTDPLFRNKLTPLVGIWRLVTA